MAAVDGASLTLTACTFDANKAEHPTRRVGGSIYVAASSLVATDTTVAGSSGPTPMDGLVSKGGGAYIEAAGATA